MCTPTTEQKTKEMKKKQRPNAIFATFTHSNKYVTNK